MSEQEKPIEVPFKTLSEAWANRCEQSPNHTFLIEDDRQITYGEMDQLIQKFIKFFEEVGVRPRDIVAIQLPTSLLSIKLIITCFKLNIVVMPLSTHLDIEEFQDILTSMKPKLLILSSDILADYLNSGEQFSHYEGYVLPELCKTVEKINYFVSSRSEVPDLAEDIAAILATSGTTGTPKGVLLSQENILYSEICFTQTFEIDEDDVLLLSLPVNHAIGFHHGIVSTILSGSTCVILESYDPKESMALIKQHHCTYTLSVPTTAYDLFMTTNENGFLKKIICGGSPISAQLLQESVSRNVPIYNVFGTTESVPFICTSPAYFEKKHGTTAGFPINGVTVKLVNKRSQIITEPGHSGEVYVRGPIVFKGYFRNLRATQQVLSSDGWFRTGDLAHINEDGAIKVDGRINDLIMRGGENISAVLVEKFVSAYPKIQQVAAIGLKDKRLGERIGICVVPMEPQEQITLSEIKNFLMTKQVLKKYWPERLIICTRFPMTDSGKIRKNLLKQHLDEYIRPNINHIDVR